jgi:adenosylcobinamide-phosphate synthase
LTELQRDLLFAVALDLLLGDPRWLPHPVQLFGGLATQLEKFCRALIRTERLAGTLFWLIAVGLAALITQLTLPWARIYWIWTCLALRELDRQPTRAVQLLAAGRLAGAREAVSLVVGRDTAHMDEAEVLRAATETVAENFNDAVTAPLFYLAVGGPVAMAVYKAINTLDSMVGYPNDRYRWFGWMSARADDLAGWIPARISAAVTVLCAPLVGGSVVRAARIVRRDASLQPSPNSGYPEAAFAGALDVRLGGLNYYGGVPKRKAWLGDDLRSLTLERFQKARVLLYISSTIVIALTWVALG